jgi:hypothetical protein
MMRAMTSDTRLDDVAGERWVVAQSSERDGPKTAGTPREHVSAR